MKNKLTKLISSLLIIASLVSAMSVFAVAADEVVEEENEIITAFNRGFDDGWTETNGASWLSGSNVHFRGYGEKPTPTGVDYYLEMTSGDETTQDHYTINTPAKVKTINEYVFEFDFRSDGMKSDGAFLLSRIEGLAPMDETLLQRSSSGQVLFQWNRVNLKLFDEMPEEWTHVAFTFKTNPAMRSITVCCYVDGVKMGEATKTDIPGDLSMRFFRFQYNDRTSKIGDNLCIDNIKYYYGTTEITELAPDDYGLCVDTGMDKTVTQEGVKDDGAGKTDAEYIQESYIMKVGTNRALKAGKRVNIFEGPLTGEYGAPLLIDGVVYLPLIPILDHMGLKYSVIGESSIDIAIAAKDSETGAVTTGVTSIYIGRTGARVAGADVTLTGAPGIHRTGLYYEDESGEKIEASYIMVAMDDIETLFPGWYITYDKMGFIMLAEADELLNRGTQLERMLELMQEFVYDDPKADEILTEMSAATNGFDHPYLYGNDEDFAFLRAVYNDEYLKEDGTPNEEFLALHGLTLEQMKILDTYITKQVNLGIYYYVSYIVPESLTVNGDPNYFFEADGDAYKSEYYDNEKMYDEDGNFIYPYVKEKGKNPFAPMFSTRATERKWSLVEDAYVIATEISNSTPKRDYKLKEDGSGCYYVGAGNGEYDYISYDFASVKDYDSYNYKYNEDLGEYEDVGKGKGTHYLLGFDENGKPIYSSETYGRKERPGMVESDYNFAFPIKNYMNFNTDPKSDGFLELDEENPTLCQDCGKDHFGYDHGSRLESATHISYARSMAFAYLITGEINYARLAYDVLDIMGGWQHWGTAHMLQYAIAAAQYGLALDWLYDVVVEMSENGETNFKGEPVSVKVLQQHLWNRGIGEDYLNSVMGQYTVYLRDNIDTEVLEATEGKFAYYDNTDNWGNVCNGNLAIAGMALLSYTDTLTADSEIVQVYLKEGINFPLGSSYQSLAAETLEVKFWCLHYYAAHGYAPDGAFFESPSYWAYGTNNFFFMISILYKMLGHHYTLLDAPGYDKTFTYAAYMESVLYRDEEGKKVYDWFEYNDCDESYTTSGQDTSYFFTAGVIMNQPELVKIRMDQMNEKGLGLADIFYFKEAMQLLKDVEGYKPALEYVGESIDLFTTRSSWDEETPLFAGIMGGVANNANHGHLDVGSWVFYDEGQKWIIDLAKENYNVQQDTDYPSTGDWNASTKEMKLHHRYRYYRMSAEGHNTLILTGRQDTLPYGMNAWDAYAHLLPVDDAGNLYYSDDNGSYVMYDMTDIYASISGDRYANSAKRGMLLTNGRKTLVIQDEIDFKTMEYFAWSAHTGARITPSEDGKHVYLSVGELVCRMSIVMENNGDSRYKFEVRSTSPTEENSDSTYLLNATYGIDIRNTIGGEAQKSRGGIQNVVITPRDSGGTLVSDSTVRLAVVIEVFQTYRAAEDAPVSYQYTPMSEWETYEEGRYSNVVKEDLREDPGKNSAASLTKMRTNASAIKVEYENVNPNMNKEIQEIDGIYSMLTDSTWIINGTRYSSLTGDNRACADMIRRYAAAYDKYVAAMNEKLNKASFIIDKLT